MAVGNQSRKTKNFEIGRKPISNPKSEISNWTAEPCGSGALRVQFKISDFGFEMGFRSISKFPFSCLRLVLRYFIAKE
jgi:hypothetical protein